MQYLSVPVFLMWVYIGFTSIKAYRNLSKETGFSHSALLNAYRQKDPDAELAIYKWKIFVRNRMLMWIATIAAFLLIVAIVSNTIGFKDTEAGGAAKTNQSHPVTS